MRTCSGCTLCCRLLPVAELEKGANQRCQHQRFGKGCAIYSSRPRTCMIWSCRWLLEDDTADLRRPDRCGYVIDPLPDFIKINGEPFEVIQVWLDPRSPDAYKDPALRAYLARQGKAALVRFDARQAMVLFPPGFFADDNEWHETLSACTEHQHSSDEIADTVGMDALAAASYKLMAHAIK